MSTLTRANHEPRIHRRSGLLVSILVSLVLVSAGGYCYWRFIHYPSTPHYTVEELLAAGKTRNYDRVYDLVKLTGPLRAAVRSPADVREYARRFPALIPDVEEYRISESSVEGNRATVTVNVLATRAGQTSESRIEFKLVRDAGIWRIDGDWIVAEAVRNGLGGALLGGLGE